MGAIKRLFDYKTEALNRVILNDNIVKALCDNTPQFIDNSDQTILDNRDELINTLVYPYMAITSQFTDAQSYITLSLGDFEADYTIDEGWIELYVLCHKQIVRTEVGQRHGFIADEIDTMMKNSRGFGIGKITRSKFSEFHLGSEKDYVGFVLKYYITDFALNE